MPLHGIGREVAETIRVGAHVVKLLGRLFGEEKGRLAIVGIGLPLECGAAPRFEEIGGLLPAEVDDVPHLAR